MSIHIKRDNLHVIHSILMEELLDRPDFQSAPRGKEIRELLGASFTLTNPRARLIDSPARNLNYGFAVGELCWYVRGDNDLATMTYYNKRMPQFSDDGKTINSAYGHRIFKSRWYDYKNGECIDEVGVSQLDNAIQELVRDPDSRRAILHINEPFDLMRAVGQGSKDVPCTLSLQLFIRDRKLHMHVNMRSNDIAWGFPYDVFSFTCLQEAFLYKLQEAGAPVDDLGHYHHSAGSLHLYSTHYDMAALVSKETIVGPPPMAPFTLEKLEQLAHEDEPYLRKDPGWGCADRPAHESSIGWMLARLVEHGNKRLQEEERKK